MAGKFGHFKVIYFLIKVSEIGSLEMIRSCHTDDYTLLFGTDVIKQRSAVGQVAKYDLR